MKIAIIGGGIFGLTAFIKLRKNNFNCFLFEKNKSILAGATSNNLNRIHYGYHYPRDTATITQSKKCSKSFIKMYSKSIISNFENYYAISRYSKTSVRSYKKILSNNKLKFKEVNKIKNLNFKNLDKIFKVNEPIYSWKKLNNIIKKQIKPNENRIFLKTKVTNISKIKDDSFKISFANKKTQSFDVIIDASYEGSNTFTSKISNIKRNIYQLTCVLEVQFSKIKSIGLAIMDGPFFSFLPNGHNKNRFLLYHVKHSVIKENKAKKYNYNWLSEKNNNLKFAPKIDLIKKDLNFYLPNINFKIKKYFFSARVFDPKSMKQAKRISYLDKTTKNYYKIVSGKVVHAVEISNQLISELKKNYI